MDRLFGYEHDLDMKKEDKGQSNYEGRALISNWMICLKNFPICTDYSEIGAYVKKRH